MSLSLLGLGFGGFPTQRSTDLGSRPRPGVPARRGFLLSAFVSQRLQQQSEYLPKASDSALAQPACGAEPDQHEDDPSKHQTDAAIHECLPFRTLNLLQTLRLICNAWLWPAPSERGRAQGTRRPRVC